MKYMLCDIKKKKNKENKDYYLAYVLLSDENNCDLINCLITSEQANLLMPKCFDKSFDLTKYVTMEWNSYQKKFIPKITYNQNVSRV